jgi:hypothetical protein
MGITPKRFFNEYLNRRGTDEPTLTSHMQFKYNHINMFVMECVVVHYSFAPQNINSSNKLFIEYQKEATNLIR